MSTPIDDALLRLAVDKAANGLVLVDAAGTIVFANRQAEVIFGYGAGELIDRPLSVLVPERARAAHQHHHATYVAHPEPRIMGKGRELWGLRRDGVEFPLEIGLSFIPHPSGPYVLASVVDLTERRRAEANVRWLSLAVEQGPTSVVMTDLEGKIEYVNPKFTEITGYTLEEALGKTPRILKSGETPVEIYRDLWQRITAGQPWHGELLNRKKDGSSYWDAVWVYPIRDDAGRVTRFLALKEDITDRKRAEAAVAERTRVAELSAAVGAALTTGTTLRESLQACCEAIVSHVDAAFARIWTLNTETNVLELEASAGLYTHLDGPHSRVPVGQFKIGLIASERRPHVTNDVVGDPRVNDQEWAKREGMVAFAGFPLLFRDRVVGVVAMFARHPVSDFERDALSAIGNSIAVAIERRRAEANLRRREEHFRALVERSGDAIALLDRAGHVTYASPSTSSVLGRAPESVVGMNAFDLLHPDDVADVRRAVATMRGHPGLVSPVRSRFRHGDGAWHDGEGTLTNRLDDPAVQAVVFNYRDVTDRNQLEGQLRQAQKMEAIGRLAGGVAHDFNNVLTAVFGYVDLLAEELPAESGAHQDLAEVRKAAERAAGLTRQLLAFSRQQVLEPVVLEINDLIEDFEKMLRRVIGEDIELRLALGKDVGNVLTDPGQLHQVIMNLAVNARDAMPTGGTLIVETANADLSEQYAELRQPVIPGRYVMVAVSDTGTGMTPEVKARIFEPFFTTKERGKGTGLGLSTVYGIVKQSGGYIWAYSELGKGTTFKVYLPRVDAAAQGVKRPVEAPSLAGTETVLLAEDDAMLRPLAKNLLEKLGYTVLEAENAPTAIALAAAHDGPIHLLVADVVMPGPSGRELARRLAETRPGTKVLYVSGYTDDAIVHHGMLEPGLNFLQKPFTPAALARKVREVLDAT